MFGEVRLAVWLKFRVGCFSALSCSDIHNHLLPDGFRTTAAVLTAAVSPHAMFRSWRLAACSPREAPRPRIWKTARLDSQSQMLASPGYPKWVRMMSCRSAQGRG